MSQAIPEKNLTLSDLSLVIVNYNSSHEISALLTSIENAGYADLEIVIIDNGSTHDSLTDIEKQFPYTNCVSSDINLGFAGGNNVGYSHTTKELLFFVNPDTRIQADFFEPILNYFNTHENIGLLSPRIMYNEGDRIVQYAGTTAMNRITLRTSTHGIGQAMHDDYLRISPTYFGHGAAMFLRRSVIESVGLMNEDYFLYYEELDWCERIRRQGFQVIYFGPVEITHLESISVGKESPLKTYYMSRNRLYFARLHFSLLFVFLNFMYAFFILMPKAIISYRNQPELLKAWFKGFTWHFSNK